MGNSCPACTAAHFSRVCSAERCYNTPILSYHRVHLLLGPNTHRPVSSLNALILTCHRVVTSRNLIFMGGSHQRRIDDPWDATVRARTHCYILRGCGKTAADRTANVWATIGGRSSPGSLRDMQTFMVRLGREVQGARGVRFEALANEARHNILQ
ncbi:hypothetical protein C8R44DRAFT_982967, partial [Mycena epipterygia]